jgi:hypothetical protein
MTWDLDKAIATPLTQAQVRNLTLTDGYEPGSLTLYGHFRESANSTEFEELKHGRNIRAIQFAAME